MCKDKKKVCKNKEKDTKITNKIKFSLFLFA